MKNFNEKDISDLCIKNFMGEKKKSIIYLN
jgi:hypothetical protein